MITLNCSLALQTKHVLSKTWKEGNNDSQKGVIDFFPNFQIQATPFLSHLFRIKHQVEGTFYLSVLFSSFRGINYFKLCSVAL